MIQNADHSSLLAPEVRQLEQFKAHYPMTATSLRLRSNIAPKWVAKLFPCDTKI